MLWAVVVDNTIYMIYSCCFSPINTVILGWCYECFETFERRNYYFDVFLLSHLFPSQEVK